MRRVTCANSIYLDTLLREIELGWQPARLLDDASIDPKCTRTRAIPHKQTVCKGILALNPRSELNFCFVFLFFAVCTFCLSKHLPYYIATWGAAVYAPFCDAPPPPMQKKPGRVVCTVVRAEGVGKGKIEHYVKV